MKILKLTQGSNSWHTHRAAHFNASDAPVIMGLSSYKTRDELLHEKKTGITPEVTPATQAIFDDGHKFESMAREIIEANLGEELYPITGFLEIDGLQLSASFDGIDFSKTFCFEHKTLNSSLTKVETIDDLDKQYKVQMQQQMMISGCSKCLFVASKGVKEGMVQLWYESDDSLADEIIAHWKQFAIDLAAYEHRPEVIKPDATPIMELPSLLVEVHGGVKNSNLTVYESSALNFIRNINTDLKTDEDFANAEETVKFCGKAEKQLDLVKQQAIAQTTDIETLFNTMDRLREELRTKRLSLEKLVKAQKATIKSEILREAMDSFKAHIATTNEGLGGNYLPAFGVDFSGAMKGKRTITSIRGAANDELARVKIEVSAKAEAIRINLASLRDLASDYKFLFSDVMQIITKANDDLVLLINSRINEHKKSEEDRLEAEREKIRQEEAAKLQAEADKKTENGAQANHEQVEKQQYRAPVNPSRTLGHPGPAERSSKTEPREDITPTFYKEDAINAIRETAKPMSEKKALAILAAIERGDIPGVQAYYSTSKQEAA